MKLFLILSSIPLLAILIMALRTGWKNTFEIIVLVFQVMAWLVLIAFKKLLRMPA